MDTRCSMQASLNTAVVGQNSSAFSRNRVTFLNTLPTDCFASIKTSNNYRRNSTRNQVIVEEIDGQESKDMKSLRFDSLKINSRRSVVTSKLNALELTLQLTSNNISRISQKSSPIRLRLEMRKQQSILKQNR